MRTGLTIVLVSLALLRTAHLRAAEPSAPLPPPRALTPLVTGFERPNPYDVWKFYAVDRRGTFRPRVVLDPGMPFYLATGEPYPLLNVKPRVFMPYITD